MSVERIPLPKDEVNSSLFCCFPTRSWSGKRINGYHVVEMSFDKRGQFFILRLKNQELFVTLTKNLIKSLHYIHYRCIHEKKNCTYGFTDLEKEMVNGCRVVNKSYVENGPSFVLNLDGHVEPVTVSKDLVKYHHNHQFKSPSIFD